MSAVNSGLSEQAVFAISKQDKKRKPTGPSLVFIVAASVQITFKYNVVGFTPFAQTCV